MSALQKILPAACCCALFMAWAAPAAAAPGYYNFNDSLKAAVSASSAATPAAEHALLPADDMAARGADDMADSKDQPREDAGYDAEHDDAADDTAAGLPPVQPATQPAQNHVVTSVMKCYDQIGRAAALKIRETSLTPYADCQKKLRQKAADAEKNRTQKKDADAPAETPENFIRVREKDDRGAAGYKTDKNE